MPVGVTDFVRIPREFDNNLITFLKFLSLPQKKEIV